MAASAATASSAFGLCPNYAVICSFLERYGALLDLPELTFPQLERYLQDTSSVPKLLIDLHVKLLRKIGKSVSADRWEKYLVKVCQEFNTTWAWELEQKGYKEMQTECKAAILKYLCECQFDDNIKFKTAINEEDPDQMRIQPIGRDKDGQMYWFQLDQDDNVRVYVEEQDDLDGSSWKCIVKNRNDLAEVVALLKTQIDPELLKREKEAEEKKEKTEGEVKQLESSSDEDGKDNVTCPTSPKTSQKDSWTDSSVSQKSAGECQAEAEACSGKLADVSVSSNQKLVKMELLDVPDRRTITESSAVSVKMENGEEVKTNGEVKNSSPEEIQQALKSQQQQQQAKIPLKKRGMKFSEDFDKSSIVVPNASLYPPALPLHQGDPCAKTETEEKRASLKDHINGDVQPENKAEKELQRDPQPSEAETLQQKTSPPEEAPAAAPPPPKHSSHQREEHPEELTRTEGPSLRTEERPEGSAHAEGPSLKTEECPEELTHAEGPSLRTEERPEELTHAEGPSLKTEQRPEVSTHTEGPSLRTEERPEELTHTEGPSLKTEERPEVSTHTEGPSLRTEERPEELTHTEGPSLKTERRPEVSTHADGPSLRTEERPEELTHTEGPSLKTEERPEEPTHTEGPSLRTEERPEELTQGPSLKTKQRPETSTHTEGPSLKTEEHPETRTHTEGPSLKTKERPETRTHTEGPSLRTEERPEEPTHTEGPSLRTEERPEEPTHTEGPSLRTEECPEEPTHTEGPSLRTGERPEEPTHTEGPSLKMEECPEEPTHTEGPSLRTGERPEEPTHTEGPSLRTGERPEEPTHTEGPSLKMEECPEEPTHTEGPSLKTPVIDGADTQMEVTDSRGDAQGEKEEIRELMESADREAPPPSTPPPCEPNMAETQKPSSPEAKSTSKTKESHSSEAPEKEEPPEEQRPNNTDAGRGASEQEAGQVNQPTPHAEASTLVEEAGEEEPSEPSEGTNTWRETDLKPVRMEEDECRSPSPGNTNNTEGKTSQLPHLDPSADTNEEEENVEKGGQKKAEDQREASEVHEETEVDKPEPQTKEVVNGEEALPAPQTSSKRPSHRRRAQVQLEDWPADPESDAAVGRCLRRSPRISRPTTKTVETHEKSTQNSTPAEKEEDEKSKKEKDQEEEQEVKATQKKPREKKVDQEAPTKSKARKRRKVRWSNTRTHHKKRSSEEEASNQETSEEEDSEEEDDSDEDYKVERGRRRRNRNRERRSSDSSTSSDEDLPPNDDPCKHCGLPNHPELILLCDFCDSGYHTACLRPPLMIIPDGEWFCPPCQHKQLCDKLQEQLQNLDAALKKKERAERRKERLIYVGISVENIIAPSVEEEPKPEIIKEKKEVKKMKSWGRRSTRTKKSISYRFDEFDEAIEEAIEEDVKEAEGGGAGRGKDMSNITGLRGKDMSAILQAEEGKENGQPQRASSGQRRKKRRRLNDLDSDSTVDEEESEDEFCLSESSDEFVASDNESEAESGAESNPSEGSEARRSGAHSRRTAQRHSARKRQRPSWYSDEDEEDSGEEEEEEIATEGSSEFSDGDLDMSRRRSRRSHKAQVNYRETSESEGSQADSNRPRMKARRRMDSSESEVSFSGNSEDGSRGKRRAGSSEEDSRERRRRLALKRRRASEEDNSDDSSDESSEEEDRPVRKRVNRIDSDDSDEDAWTEKKAAEKVDEGSNLADAKLGPPSSNGQSRIKSPEGPAAPPRDLLPNVEAPKAATLAPNGVSAAEVGQDEDEDDLLGVTDLVDYVCNNEDL